ncbi:hypothetical protein SPHFLASMR4Y_01689 [Sphingorhabdus sp. SMR4y]|nr:hypothetical protein SPHFLASMR4Y_01689 [Sphingorhabdus sp. SMR4y]
MSFSYSAYGLNFRSDISLPFQPTSPREKADVTVEFGEIPEALGAGAVAWRNWQADDSGFLLCNDGIPCIFVSGGDTMIIAPHCKPFIQDIMGQILGSASAGLLHQRQHFLLHSSAIATERGAAAFAGRSGAGKSTLLAEFLNRKAVALSDDVLAISTRDTSQIIASPSYPVQKLCADVLERSGKNAAELQPILNNRSKFYAPIEDFARKPAPLRAIFCMEACDVQSPVFDIVTPQQAMPLIAKASYRKKIAYALGFAKQHFQNVEKLARNVTVIHVRRPRDIDSISQIADMVEERLATLPARKIHDAARSCKLEHAALDNFSPRS